MDTSGAARSPWAFGTAVVVTACVTLLVTRHTATGPLAGPLEAGDGCGQDFGSALNMPLLATHLQANQEGQQHVVVTGGAGFIGSHAAMRLLNDGHYVTVLDNLSRGNYNAIRKLKSIGANRFAFYDIDLNDEARLDRVFNDMISKRSIDYLIHFAAVAFVAESYSNPILYYKNVTANTAYLVETMTKYGVNNMIYSSSCATYGSPTKIPITEETPQEPVSPYGMSKFMAERVLIDHAKSHKQFGVIMLRYFNVIGADPQGRFGESPDLSLPASHHRISTACFLSATGKYDHLTITGTDHPTPDGTCVRDYVHVVDLVDAHVKSSAIIKAGEAQYFNVGVGKGYSVREFVKACKAATGVNMKVVEGPRRPGDAAQIFANPSKIKAAINWEPQHTDLTAALTNSWSWFKSHPKGRAQGQIKPFRGRGDDP